MTWRKAQEAMDIKSGLILTILFLFMLWLIAYCHITGKPLQSEAVVFALGVIGFKAGTTILKKPEGQQ